MTRCTLDSTEDSQRSQVLPQRRGRGSWPVGGSLLLSQLGTGKHQLDSHTALCSGGQQHEGLPLTDVSFAIDLALSLSSFSRSHRDLILEYV